MIGIVTNSSTSTRYNFAKAKVQLRQSIKRKKAKPSVDNEAHIAEEINDSNAKAVLNSGRSSSKRDWNSRGWIRVYCGPYRDGIDLEEASRMVNIVSKATTMDVVRDMDLPQDYSLWVR